MTKILMPFRKIGGLSIHDSKTYGGLEKFCQLIIKNVKDYDIHVVEYEEEDVKARRKIDIIVEAVSRIKPDVILTNYIEPNMSYDLSCKVDCPIVMIIHSLGETIQYKNRFIPFRRFTDAGNTIYMVSPHQKKTWERLSGNLNLPMFDVDGFISPAFCEYSIFNESEHDIITVGRTDRTKDPFFMERKFSNSGLNYKIITSSAVMESNMDYYEKYKDVDCIRDLPHVKVMEMISKSKVYLSTCPSESWGIVQLEALSCGVPVLSVTRYSSAISSISPVDWGYQEIKKGASLDEYMTAFSKLASLSIDDRKELARLTREKHSKEAWLKNFAEMIEGAIAKYQRCDTMESFFE